MIHIRVDGEIENSKRKFACGIGPALPKGDKYFFQSEVGSHYRVDCPGCRNPAMRHVGVPIGQLSGRPGHPGYDVFCRIAGSWGYE